MFTTRPELVGTYGMVASTHWLPAQTGMSVLEHDGNAFDAAVAAAFVLQVVQPDQNGPGGEIPILAHEASSGSTFLIDGQGPAPMAATPEVFRDLGLDLVPGDGLLPACVPAMFGSLTLLLEKYGTMRLRDVLQYAIDYAENGFPITPLTVLTIADAAERFRTEWPSNAEVYLPDGEVPSFGSQFKNPKLAATFRRVLDEAESLDLGREAEIVEARRIWYKGFVAEAIDAFYRKPAMDSTGSEHVGLLRYSDLANWEPSIEEPVSYDYKNFTIFKPQTWSQGAVLLQQLALLDGFDLEKMGPGSADFIHTVVESAKLAFADREAFYGDPKFAKVPLDILLSKEYNDERRTLITDQASPDLRPGEIEGYSNLLPAYATRPTEDSTGHLPIPFIVPGSGRTNGDTVHIDVADRFGNLVSATPSGGFLWGAPVVPELGFAINIRAQIFALDEDHANSIQPGKRPRTTLSPSLAFRDGKPYMAFGTPGGDMQDQWPLIFLLNHIHFGMNLQEAIDSPTWHSTHFPSSFLKRPSSPLEVQIEARIPETVRNELIHRGHKLVEKEDWSLGMTSAVTRQSDGTLRAGASPRGLLGYAVGR